MSVSTDEPLAPWQVAWRQGFAPLISNSGLKSLLTALEEDDPRLLQGATTMPPPLQCVMDWPVEGACALGYCGWRGDGLDSVGEVEEYFAQRCFECDQAIGEPAGCRHFLNWFDDTPRHQMRAMLIAEVVRSMEERRQKESAPS